MFNVPAKTADLEIFSISILSPVIADSLTQLCPDRSSPSVGMRSPGFINISSPINNESILVWICWLPLMTVAVVGCINIKVLITFATLNLDFSSI